MLKGTLDDFGLGDIFKLMSFSKKTGRLELIRKAGMGRIFFRDGEVYYAESSLSREPLGQKLIRARALTDSSLRKALDQHAETGERVGQILLREGAISEQQLEAGVKQQIEDAVFDLLRWELGEFEWEPGATLEPEVPISVSVENLIMESSRRLDELEVISRKVPSSQAVLAVTPAPPEGAVEINITPDEWRVLVLVDGHRSVETIANTIGLDEFQTMRIVHGMVSAGLIEVSGVEQEADIVAPPPPPLEAVVPPPPPPPSVEDEDEPVAMEEMASEDEVAAEEPFHPVGEEPFSLDPQQVEETQDEFQSTEGAPADLPDSFVAAFEDALGDVPDDADVVEETLFEANGSSNGLATDASTPPEEWFTDPDLSMELFDAPASGDLMTEVPDAALETDESDEADAEANMPEAAAQDVVTEAEVAEPNLISDDTVVDLPPAPELPSAETPSAPDVPPPPPVPPVEGAERHAAVRELADLFDDNEPVERPRPPVIRRIEPTSPEAARKRRVEDDEQVTKGLISRLIEGVKGL